MMIRNFTATVERTRDRLNWIVIRVPLDVAKVWGKRGQLRVRGEIAALQRGAAGFAFRTSLFPDGKGQHFMMVNKQMQAGANVAPGMMARFRMEPDTAERTVSVPQELVRALSQDRRLRKYYDALSHSTRREIARWIAAGKHAETRARRAEQMAERLFAVMEAERELPPVLQAALARHPKARAGWAAMPPSHRRAHLLGIFGYRNPESRARRVAKAVKMMVEYAEGRRHRESQPESEAEAQE